MSEQRLCNLDELQPGHLHKVEIEGLVVAVCRLPDGQVVAFEDFCTHDGAPFGHIQTDGDEIECPRHGARFDLRSGAALSAPATAALDCFSTRVGIDGVVYARLEGEP